MHHFIFFHVLFSLAFHRAAEYCDFVYSQNFIELDFLLVYWGLGLFVIVQIYCIYRSLLFLQPVLT